MPCAQQIQEGEPHGSVVTPGGYKQGHRRCADAFHRRKMVKEAKERHDAMVKRVDQPQGGGAIDWTTERDGIIGSVPLEKSPGKPLADMELPEGVRPISDVPMDYGPREAQALAEGRQPTFEEFTGAREFQKQLSALDLKDKPMIPQDGFQPDAFPSVAVAFIPYNSGSAHAPRPDPTMSINDDGWMFIETGNVRLAMPDREEWQKFVSMGEALWNTHQSKT